ncbi:signal recognition particle protein [Candidatus Poribacteria bacterium]|nr:signal recognition particle protein [Candidatus Poribacteria bacterium]MXY28407.1 signal recognition particle protein [Candidatus Poribacteria bacterium]MYK18352.1 signal recognition particle protein [Candidatus Poribacteria bacterium]
MFESLGNRLQGTLKKIRGQGKLTESNISDTLREVRRAFLEADVNYKVTREFIEQIKARTLGQEVLGSLTPELQIARIIGEELTQLMGSKAEKINIAPSGPTVVMLVGLQGAGKTTVAAKLALRFRRDGRKPLLVAADVYRPAAIKQLQILGEQTETPVFSMGTEPSPVEIAEASVKEALAHGHNCVIIDTAGRLHVNDELMSELRQIKERVNPSEVLLIVDAMTGQDAVNVAENFNNDLDIDGVILTKMDGDARGGAALSIRHITHKPIKFIGVGEKIEAAALEEFHPERMASRILGQGDFQTLLEKAEEVFSEDQAKELERKLTANKGLDFTDFLTQLEQLKNMGPLDQLMDLMPFKNQLPVKNLTPDESHLQTAKAIIQSMTGEERRNPRLLDRSRKLRISKGSGTTVNQVNMLISQLQMMNRMLNQQAAMAMPQMGAGLGAKRGRKMGALPGQKRKARKPRKRRRRR